MTLEQIIDQWFWGITQDNEQLTPPPDLARRIQGLANRIQEAGWVNAPVLERNMDLFRDERDRYHEALEKIVYDSEGSGDDYVKSLRNIATNALRGKE